MLAKNPNNMYKLMKVLTATQGHYRGMRHSPIFLYCLGHQSGPHFSWSTMREDNPSQSSYCASESLNWWGYRGRQKGINKSPPWGFVATNYFNWSVLHYWGIVCLFFHSQNQWRFPLQKPILPFKQFHRIFASLPYSFFPFSDSSEAKCLENGEY